MSEAELHAPVDAPDDLASLYGSYYYAHDCGIPYARNAHWMAFFGAIADSIVRSLRPATMLDAGCAMGLLVEQLHDRGVDVHGIDISEYAISKVPDSLRERCRVASLTEPIEGRYDLVVTVEVIEHIPAADAERALDNLCAITDAVLFSSSPHDYGEATHINVKTPEQWAVRFAERGFYRDVDHDASYLTDWATLYRRRTVQTPDVVLDYERLVWTTRTEVRQLRATVLEAQRQLEAIEAGDGSQTPLAERLERTENELIATRQALLVARDAIAGYEVRVGEALGERDRLASLAASREAAVRELNLMHNSRVWKAISKVLAPLRAYRARRAR